LEGRSTHKEIINRRKEANERNGLRDVKDWGDNKERKLMECKEAVTRGFKCGLDEVM
jgi:hypothetical protein